MIIICSSTKWSILHLYFTFYYSEIISNFQKRLQYSTKVIPHSNSTIVNFLLHLFHHLCTCSHTLSLSIHTLHMCVNTYPLYFFLDLLEEAANIFIPSPIIPTCLYLRYKVILYNEHLTLQIRKWALVQLPSSPKNLFIFHDYSNNISFFSGSESYSGIHVVFSYISSDFFSCIFLDSFRKYRLYIL